LATKNKKYHLYIYITHVINGFDHLRLYFVEQLNIAASIGWRGRGRVCCPAHIDRLMLDPAIRRMNSSFLFQHCSATWL